MELLWFSMWSTALAFVVLILRFCINQKKFSNPFKHDSRIPKKPFIHDQKLRNAIIKQGFAKKKIPENLDAIIIGSGLGGLTTGAIMSLAGRRVLVLEQHDQAGGCCHTWGEGGWQWDVGVHYVGEMGRQTLNKTLLDQICQGQVEWAAHEDAFDVIQLGYGSKARTYPVATGLQAWKDLLHKQFPRETKAITKYFELLEASTNTSIIHMALKIIPLWIVRSVIYTGILKYFLQIFRPEFSTTSSQELVEGLTRNKDLQAVLLYCWGNYGTPPSRSNFTMHGACVRHIMKQGAFYPVGGSSEMALNIIPVIEAAGGRVLVRASVTEILSSDNKVCGVRVGRGRGAVEILAPIVLSSAGLYNTFQKLLPREVAKRSYYSTLCRHLKPGGSCMNVWLGLGKSSRELGLKRQNMYAFTSNDIDKTVVDYFQMSVEDAMDSDVPLLFISSPSVKNPQWESCPEREGKSTVTIMAPVNWQWFSKFKGKTVKKRGDSYEEIKRSIGHKMIEQTCTLYPQLKDCIDHISIGSPVSNAHYLSQPHGEIYGLDHSLERLDPLTMAQLRPQTDIPGLRLTGQDTLYMGVAGALFSGLLGAQAALGRNLMVDLVALHVGLEGLGSSLTDIGAGRYCSQ